MELGENSLRSRLDRVERRITDRYLSVNPNSVVDDDVKYYLLDPDMDSEVLSNYTREDMLNQAYDLGEYYTLTDLIRVVTGDQRNV